MSIRKEGLLPIATQVGYHYRDRLDDVTWERLTVHITKDHEEISLVEAEQIMDATIGFLLLCGRNRTLGFTPSEKVDIGWHTFLLYTKEYAQFCQEQVGFFVHHVPSDIPGEDYTFDGGVDAVTFMREHGIAFSEDMWPTSRSRCSRAANPALARCCGAHQPEAVGPDPDPEPGGKCCGGC